MNAHFRLACLIIAIALIAATSAIAAEVTVDISDLANALWTSPFCDNGIVDASTFPSGSQTFGGVPFAIPTAPNNYWSGALAGNCGSGTVNLTVQVGVYGVGSVFTLLNTFRGEAGPNAYLYITFNGSGGATSTVPLVGGVRVRNYNSGGFPQTINGTSTIQVWTDGEGQRLDRQEYILPAEFATQTLTSVTITDTGSYDQSRAIFSGLTVSTCGAYLAEGITQSSSKIADYPYLGLYAQKIALTNAGSTAIPGPLFFILEDLPPGVTLVNRSGVSECIAPGSRYVVPLPEGSSLAPNTSLVFDLWFSDPSASAITYTPLTASSRSAVP